MKNNNELVFEFNCSMEELDEMMAEAQALADMEVQDRSFLEVKNWENLSRIVDETCVVCFPIFSNIPQERWFDKDIKHIEDVVHKFIDSNDYEEELDSDVFDFLVQAYS